MNAWPPSKRSLWLSRAVLTLSIVAFFVLGIGAYQYTIRSSTAKAIAKPAEQSPLKVAAERLNFGITWEQPEFKWTVPIRNNSDREIEIENFVKSCNCASIEPRSLVIPAGETRDVQLTFDLRTS